MALSRTFRALDNPADEEYLLVARRKQTPHNQQIETDALRALLISGIEAVE
ncbi:hypothetical protein JYT92_00150 [bacterium AH-315-L15]|nr:hypothetical protein [bacterium AH-315-L15]